MSFIKKIFSSKKEKPRATLESAKDLIKGDILKFGFTQQNELSNQQFEVIEINTYDFENSQSTAFTLKGANNLLLWLNYEDDDGDEYLAISRKLSREEVKTLFDEQQVAKIFEEGCMEIGVQQVPKHLENWISDNYTETKDCCKVYIYKEDYRNKTLPEHADDATEIDYYLLEDDQEDYAIEIEVENDGETEVFATIYINTNCIDELWPVNNTKN